MNFKNKILIFGAILLIVVALLTIVIVNFAGTNSKNPAPTTAPTTTPTTAPTTVPTTAPTTVPTTAPTTVPTTAPTGSGNGHILDGKKIIFVGNSYTYYGNMVETYTWDVSQTDTLLKRFTHDRGGFYQLCKQNGANVSITNWTFGSHTLQDLFGGGCFDKNRHPGYDHLADLKKYSDMCYDYVVIQAPTGGAITNMDDYKALLGYVCNIFRDANPNVKIIFSIPTLLYTQEDVRGTEIIKALDEMIKKYDLIEANWGKLIADILSGDVTVENSTYEYTNNTFLISKTADDGFHPNLLTGYIGTQMIYSLITGEPATGEDCSFFVSASSLRNFVNTYYKYDNVSPAGSTNKLTGDALTNFPEIFASKTDMESIQKLIDEYIKANN